MPIDRDQPPTNKVLLECGPEGIEEDGVDGTLIQIPLKRLKPRCWFLGLHSMKKNGSRSAAVYVQRPGLFEILHLGHVHTLGEAVALYELLSQRKWPGQ